ncbi:hypothetical protein AAKU64_004177 [Undibacterium sp. GrIS 1.8]
MGSSSDTFYRYQPAVESGGGEALIDSNWRKPNLLNLVADMLEDAVKAFAIEQQAFRGANYRWPRWL